MKTVNYVFHGQVFHLAMNANALFDTYERYGYEQSVADLFTGTDKKSFTATCWLLAKFAEQGELVRRYEGHKPVRIVSDGFFRANLKPLDVPAAKIALEQAVRLGFAREEADPDEVQDLYLAEIEKKKEPG